MARILFIVSGATYWVLKDGTQVRDRLLGRGVRDARTRRSPKPATRSWWRHPAA